MFDEPLVYMSVFHMNVDQDLDQDLAQAIRAAALRGEIEPDDVDVEEAGNLDWFRNLDPLHTPLRPTAFYGLASKQSEIDLPTLEAAHKRFLVCLEQQQRLLKDVDFASCVEASMANLPKLESIHISAENGGGGPDDTIERPAWLQRRHPGLLLRYRHLDGVQNECLTAIQIFKSLSRASIRPKKLAFVKQHGIDASSAWHRIPQWPQLNFLATLRRLDIAVRLTTEIRGVSYDHVEIIFPLLESATLLEGLYIQATRQPDIEDEGPFTELISLQFSHLQLFQWNGFSVDGRDLARFIEAHPRLQKFAFDTRGLSEDDWKRVWLAIRGHPNTLDLCI